MKYILSTFIQIEKEPENIIIYIENKKIIIENTIKPFLDLFISPVEYEQIKNNVLFDEELFNQLCSLFIIIPFEAIEYQLEKPIITFLSSPFFRDKRNTQSDIAILGIPFDLGTFHIYKDIGARFGPDEVRNNSISWGTLKQEIYDYSLNKQILQNINIIDYGNVPISPPFFGYDKIFNMIKTSIQFLIRNSKLAILLGGDHSITYPILTAFNDPITLIWWDAHLDCQPSKEIMHNSVLFHLSKLPYIEKIICIGIRRYEEINEEIKKILNKKLFIFTPDILKNHNWDYITKSFSKNLYISIDMDVFDPSFIPDVGYPKGFGLNPQNLIDFFSYIYESKNFNIKALDFVETYHSAFKSNAVNITSNIVSRLIVDIANLFEKNMLEEIK